MEIDKHSYHVSISALRAWYQRIIQEWRAKLDFRRSKTVSATAEKFRVVVIWKECPLWRSGARIVARHSLLATIPPAASVRPTPRGGLSALLVLNVNAI